MLCYYLVKQHAKIPEVYLFLQTLCIVLFIYQSFRHKDNIKSC